MQPRRARIERALAGNRLSADLLLAWANLQDDPGARLFWVNQALAEAGIPPLALREGEGALYDRLTSAVPLPLVEEGPKVSVLLATHDAGFQPVGLEGSGQLPLTAWSPHERARLSGLPGGLPMAP